MRKNQKDSIVKAYRILALDDDPTMTLTLQTYFERSGYIVDVENDPYKAIERVKNDEYDILLLDFLMTPICGDVVVEQIRRFNKDLYIILLTGHKSMAPPIKTIRELDIQAYYEKSDRFDQLELLIESCIKSINQMRTIKEYQKGLSGMIETMPKIYALQDMERVVASILKTAVDLLDGESGFFALDTTLHSVKNTTATPDAPYYIKTIGARLAPEEKESLQALAKRLTGVSTWHDENHLVVPIIDEKRTPMGILGVALKEKAGYHQSQLLEVFARQATAVLSNARLNALVTQKNEQLEQAYTNLKDSYIEMISAMRLLVDAKDIYTCGHSDRVSFYAVHIAAAMGMDEDYCEMIRVAGLFHDIGKVGIPDDILLKRGRLDDDEYEIIKNHSANGARILSSISRFQNIVPLVRSHHERVDGRGYPDHLTGEDIPLGAKIISVADSYDAMTSNRRYRSSLGEKSAIDELIAGKGTQFDPEMVDIFVKILEENNNFEQEVAAQ